MPCSQRSCPSTLPHLHVPPRWLPLQGILPAARPYPYLGYPLSLYYFVLNISHINSGKKSISFFRSTLSAFPIWASTVFIEIPICTAISRYFSSSNRLI